MDEITMFASLRPAAPDDAELDEMRAGARRWVAAAAQPRARWRRPALTAGLTTVVAGAAAAAVVLTTAPSAPAKHANTVVTAAWTVKLDADGTVTVDIRQFLHPAELQRVLRDDGINAYVRQVTVTTGPSVTYPTCTYADTNHAPQSVQRAVVARDLPRGWTIHPAAMPRHSALFLVGGPFKILFSRPSEGPVTAVEASQPVVLNSDKLPACVPVPPPGPGPSS